MGMPLRSSEHRENLWKISGGSALRYTPMVASLIAYSVNAFASATTGAALPVD
jgi:hypothetical protein